MTVLPDVVKRESGLVSLWRLNDVAGSIAADSFGISAGAFIGTPSLGQEGPLAGDMSSGAVLFDGSSQYVTVADLAVLDVTSAIALEICAFQVSATGTQYVIGKSNQYRMGLQAGVPFMSVYVGGVEKTATASAALSLGWHILGGTYDGVTIKVYVDGVLVKSQAQTGAISTTSNALEIGRTGSGYFNGLLSECSLYSLALSQSRMKRHFNVGRQILPDSAHSRNFDSLAIRS